MADIRLMRHGAHESHRPGRHAPHEATLTPEGPAAVTTAAEPPGGSPSAASSPPCHRDTERPWGLGRTLIVRTEVPGG